MSSVFLTASEDRAIRRISLRTQLTQRQEGIGPRWIRTGAGKRGKVMYDARSVNEWLRTRQSGGGADIPTTTVPDTAITEAEIFIRKAELQ